MPQHNQLAVIHEAGKVSEILQRDYPEIADAYREGMTQNEIIERFGLESVHRSISAVRTGVCLALKGLLSPDERQQLFQEHMVAMGQAVRDARKGIHAMTSEELGQTMTPKQRKQLVRSAMLSRGVIPWDHITDPQTGLTEEQYLKKILRSKNRRTYEDIAREINDRFYEGEAVRNWKSIKNFVYVRRRKKARA